RDAPGGTGLKGDVLFFQAADGIRDFHVTGVQTCALPIFRDALRAGLSVGAGMMSHYRAGRHVPSLATLCRLAAAVGLRVDLRPRSEERRVGKAGEAARARERCTRMAESCIQHGTLDACSQ